MTQDRWEYRLVDTVISVWRNPDNQVAEWLGQLNNLGADGWEMVTDTIIYAKGRTPKQWPVLLLKRKIT